MMKFAFVLLLSDEIISLSPAPSITPVFYMSNCYQGLGSLPGLGCLTAFPGQQYFISDVCNLKCHSGTLTKWKHFGSFAYSRIFPERVRIASFASDLVFRPLSKNMALNRRQLLNWLCISVLEEPPQDCHFIPIRHFANHAWQKQPFWPKIAHFLTWSFHWIHTWSFRTLHVNFSNFTCELLKDLTSSQQNRREKRSFSTFFWVCNSWHFDSISCVFAYIISNEVAFVVWHYRILYNEFHIHIIFRRTDVDLLSKPPRK